MRTFRRPVLMPGLLPLSGGVFLVLVVLSPAVLADLRDAGQPRATRSGIGGPGTGLVVAAAVAVGVIVTVRRRKRSSGRP